MLPPTPSHNDFDHADLLQQFHDHVNQTYAKVTVTADYGVWESHAEGCYVYGNNGKAYLDCLAGYGVMNLGHRHPKVVQAVMEQLGRIPLTTKEMLNPLQAKLGKMLADRLPGDIAYTFLCNSGTEASEGALKLARWHTGKPGIIACEKSFHGKTLGALSVTYREIFRTPVEPLLPGVKFVPYGDIAALAGAMDDTIGTVIMEPLQGEGGVNVPPPGYLAEVAALCKKRGVIFILDECQSGMGRTGALFAAIREGCEPDIITGGKGFGGGVIPAGFFAGTPDVWKKLNDFPTFHTSTFGGGQLACAAAIAAIEVTEDENVCENVVARGEQFVTGFKQLIADFPQILKEIRGVGLLLAIEFRDGKVAGHIYNRLFEEGLLVGFLLRNPTVMRIEPPLIMTEAQVDTALALFRRLFAEVTNEA